MKVIGLSGYKGSGKDEVASLLNTFSRNVYRRKRFAGKLKEMTAILIGCDVKSLEDRDFKEKPLPNLNNLSARVIMQYLGSEVGRNLYKNIWVDAAISEMVEGRSYVFTDTRFKNEADTIKKLGGIVIRINRPSLKSDDLHQSETSLDDYPFDYAITNDGTLLDLQDKVKELVKVLNL